MTRDTDPEERAKLAELGTPIGGVLPTPKPSARNPEADPDQERWQRDRWAPHSFEPRRGRTAGDVNDHTPKTETVVNPDKIQAVDSSLSAQPVHERDWVRPRDVATPEVEVKLESKPKRKPRRRREG